jgi:MraZ protein
MDQFIGEYQHKLDSKNRFSLPSKIRATIGEVVIVTKGLDGCSYVYSQPAWEEITAKLSSLSLGSRSARAFNRFVQSSATEITVDKSGRILLPENLRNHTDIDSEVIIAGVGNHLELWQPATWQNQLQQLDDSVDQMAEQLSDLGAI